MLRAALLPCSGDPFVLRMWLDCYKKYWHWDIDRLYVDLNVPPWLPSEVVSCCERMLNVSPNTSINTNPMTSHGNAIARLVQNATEELVVLVEDDAPITSSGTVASYFHLIQQGTRDLVGVPRGSCTKNIWDATERKYPGYATNQPPCDLGPNWWPCFFFCRRPHLLQTDMDFNSHGWKPGDYIKELDLQVTEDTGGDTMVWMSIQLRALGLRDHAVCGYHSYPHDMQDKPQRRHLWNPQRPWLHIGSLSTLVGVEPGQCMFAEPSEFNTYLERLLPSVQKCNSTKLELTRRYAWVNAIFRNTWQRVSLHNSLLKRYAQNLDSCEKILGLGNTTVHTMADAYSELIYDN